MGKKTPHKNFSVKTSGDSSYTILDASTVETFGDIFVPLLDSVTTFNKPFGT